MFIFMVHQFRTIPASPTNNSTAVPAQINSTPDDDLKSLASQNPSKGNDAQNNITFNNPIFNYNNLFFHQINQLQPYSGIQDYPQSQNNPNEITPEKQFEWHTKRENFNNYMLMKYGNSLDILLHMTRLNPNPPYMVLKGNALMTNIMIDIGKHLNEYGGKITEYVQDRMTQHLAHIVNYMKGNNPNLPNLLDYNKDHFYNYLDLADKAWDLFMEESRRPVLSPLI